MSDLLIRKVPVSVKRQIEERARIHRRSLSDEAIALLRQSLAEPGNERKLGTEMVNMIRPEDRGDDLVVEYRGEFPKPPDFE
jgi:antitoxin FitA